MTDFAASRFPALPPQVPAESVAKSWRAPLFALPLPLGELAVLLLAWAIILPTGH